MKDTKSLFPLNLQFFADEPQATPDIPNEPQATPNEPNEPQVVNPTPAPEPTKDEPNITLQEALNEIAKLKRTVDKTSSEAADYKRKYNATLSEKEKASLEEAEKKAKEQEEINSIRRENKIFKLEKEYLGVMKYTASEAERMAIAEVDDDKDAKIKIMAEVETRKQKEYEAEFLRNRPQIQQGTANSDEEDLFIKAFKSVQPRFK